MRQAFALAIDRAKLAGGAMSGYAFPATGGLVPQNMPGHSAGIGLHHDPDQARRLLARAGYPNGRGFPAVEWETPHGFAAVNEELQRQWRDALGIDLVWRELAWETFVERLQATPPQMFVATWAADYPDPDNFLRDGPAQLYAKWHDEVYEWLLEDAKSTFDQGNRIELYQQLDKMTIEEAVVVPLTYSGQHLLLQPWVKAFPTSPVSWWFWKDVVIDAHE